MPSDVPFLPRPLQPTTAIVVMGVAGSGKTTVGKELARQIGWTFRDADEFHPAENVTKMAAGQPLTDADRAPWLAAIRDCLSKAIAAQTGVVVTCSALKEKYRQTLLSGLEGIALVHLHGSYEVIFERLRQRQGHFMKPDLLPSQFEALEVPADAIRVSIEKPVAKIVAEIRAATTR